MSNEVMSEAGVMEQRIEQIALGDLLPPKCNPRKRMNPEKLAELKKSLKQHGVLQNLVVKPSEEESGKFEVISGERRFRGLKELEGEGHLSSESVVPCNVKTGRDAVEAFIYQLVENLQREDFDPVDEARAYLTLIERDGIDQRELAGRICKSKQYVSARMMVTLCPNALLNAFYEGRISVSHLELVGKIPAAEDRESATRKILEPQFDTKPLSRDETRELIRSEYVVSLRNPGFDPEAKGLVKDTPACSACEFRSGNNADLADDLARPFCGGGDRNARGGKSGIDPNLCLKPACFRAKSEAAWAIMQRQAEDAAQPVIGGDHARKIFSGPGGTVAWNSDFVDMDDKPSPQETGHFDSSDRVPTWRALLKGCDVEVHTAQHPDTGAIKEMVSRKVAVAAVDAKFEETGKASPFARSPAKEKEKEQAEAKEEQERKKARRKKALLALDEVVSQCRTLSDKVARMLAGRVLDMDVGALDMVAEVLGVGRHPDEVDEVVYRGETGYAIGVLVAAVIAGPMRAEGVEAEIYQRVAAELGIAVSRVSDEGAAACDESLTEGLDA